MMKFGKKGKFTLRFVDLFEILKRISKVAYKLALPTSMDHVFHVSLIYKYVGYLNHVLKTNELELVEDLVYKE